MHDDADGHEAERFEEAGRFDADHTLMPMRPDAIPAAARAAYVRGYRSVRRVGLDPNPYHDAGRPADAPPRVRQ